MGDPLGALPPPAAHAMPAHVPHPGPPGAPIGPPAVLPAAAVGAGHAQLPPDPNNPINWVHSHKRPNEEISKVVITVISDGQLHGDGGNPQKIMGRIRIDVTYTDDNGVTRTEGDNLNYYTGIKLPPANDPAAQHEAAIHHDTLAKAYCHFNEVASDPNHPDHTADMRAATDQFRANGTIYVKVDIEKLKSGDLSAIHTITWMNIESDLTFTLDYKVTAAKTNDFAQSVIRGQVQPAPQPIAGQYVNPARADTNIRDADLRLVQPPRFQGPAFARMNDLKERDLRPNDFAEAHPVPQPPAAPRPEPKLAEYLTFVEKEALQGHQNFAAAEGRVLETRMVYPPKKSWAAKKMFGTRQEPPHTELVAKSAYIQFLKDHDRLAQMKQQLPMTTEGHALETRLATQNREFLGSLPLMQKLAGDQEQRLAQLQRLRNDIPMVPGPDPTDPRQVIQPGPWGDNAAVVERLDAAINQARIELDKEHKAIKVLQDVLHPEVDATRGPAAIQEISERANQLMTIAPYPSARFYEGILLQSEQLQAMQLIRPALTLEDKALLSELENRHHQLISDSLRNSTSDNSLLDAVKTRPALNANDERIVVDVLERELCRWYCASQGDEKTLIEQDIQAIINMHPAIVSQMRNAALRLLENYESPIHNLTRAGTALSLKNYRLLTLEQHSEYYAMVHKQGRDIEQFKRTITPNTPTSERDQLAFLERQYKSLTSLIIQGNATDSQAMVEANAGNATSTQKQDCALSRALFLSRNASAAERSHSMRTIDNLMDSVPDAAGRLNGGPATVMLREYALNRKDMLIQEANAVDPLKATVMADTTAFRAALEKLHEVGGYIKYSLDLGTPEEKQEVARVYPEYQAALSAHMTASNRLKKSREALGTETDKLNARRTKIEPFLLQQDAFELDRHLETKRNPPPEVSHVKRDHGVLLADLLNASLSPNLTDAERILRQEAIDNPGVGGYAPNPALAQRKALESYKQRLEILPEHMAAQLRFRQETFNDLNDVGGRVRGWIDRGGPGDLETAKNLFNGEYHQKFEAHFNADEALKASQKKFLHDTNPANIERFLTDNAGNLSVAEKAAFSRELATLRASYAPVGLDEPLAAHADLVIAFHQANKPVVSAEMLSQLQTKFTPDPSVASVSYPSTPPPRARGPRTGIPNRAPPPIPPRSREALETHGLGLVANANVATDSWKTDHLTNPKMIELTKAGKALTEFVAQSGEEDYAIVYERIYLYGQQLSAVKDEDRAGPDNMKQFKVLEAAYGILYAGALERMSVPRKAFMDAWTKNKPFAAEDMNGVLHTALFVYLHNPANADEQLERLIAELVLAMPDLTRFAMLDKYAEDRQD